MRGTRRLVLVAPLVLFARPSFAGEPDAWAALRAGGHVALIRHASTEPGLGDPPGYRLEDCATQRNLSAQGREEARRLGERFRREGVSIEKVYNSPWCRCRDTAREAFGRSEDWEPLASFFDDRSNEAARTESVKKRITAYAARKPKGTVVMVTHHVNIQALTHIAVGTGEVVVIRPDGCCGLKVVGRLRIE